MYSETEIKQAIKPVLPLYKDSFKIQEAIASNPNGLIDIPTGTGKNHTMGTVSSLFRTIQHKNEMQIIVYVAPLILLVNDNMKTIRDRSLNDGTHCYNSIIVNSGNDKLARDHLTKEEKAKLSYENDAVCTSYDSLREELQNAIQFKQNVMVGITYHSLHKLTKVSTELGITATISYLDELHKAVSNADHYQFLKDYLIVSDRTYGFTATPGEEGGKKHNKILDLLGTVIYKLSIHDAIKKGLIVPPRWMVVEAEGTRKKHLGKGVLKAFNKAQEYMSLDNQAIVHCQTKSEVASIEQYLKKYGDKNLTIASIVSEYKDVNQKPVTHSLSVNGKEVTNLKKRQEWLDHIKEINGKLIVLHVEICKAGVDVPGFLQSIWTYFSKSETNILQGVGRSGRLLPEDRKCLELGTISTVDRSNWLKPYNIVSLLTFTDDEEDDAEEDLIDMIVRSRNLGFEPKDSILVSLKGSSKKSAFEKDEIVSMKLNNMFVTINTRIEDIKTKAQVIDSLANIDRTEILADFA